MHLIIPCSAIRHVNTFFIADEQNIFAQSDHLSSPSVLKGESYEPSNLNKGDEKKSMWLN